MLRCGRERVTRDDPCPNCDGHPAPDPNPPRVWCADCGWEPPLDLPTPRSRERRCHRCGSDRIHWQGDTPIAYCRQCHAIINSREEYCTECWQAWQTTDVWDPSDEGGQRRVRKSSWTHPESYTWGDVGRPSWSGWQHQGTETEAMLRQPESWGAIPPPTSLEAGTYRAEDYYPHDARDTKSHASKKAKARVVAAQTTRSWQPR